MGLFSAIAGIFGGGSQKKAAQKATDAMIAAYNRGIDTQNAFQQQTRSDYMPYTQAGTAAIGGLGNLIGTNGTEDQAAALSELKDSPLYSSLFSNGREALLQNASATGGLRGGNFERASMDFGADTLASVYESATAKLRDLAGLGIGAQGTVTQAGSNVANNVTDLQGNIGTAQANNYLAKGRTNSENWSNLGSALDDAVSRALPGSGILSKIFGGATASQVSNAYPTAQAVARAYPRFF